MIPLRILHAASLPEVVEENRWLVEGLWAENEVGILGGEPKAFKTFLALDLAVSVASGAPCLRHYPTRRTGRVLLYAAEDSFPDLRRRLEGICRAASVTFESLDIQVILEPSLRLDVEEDRLRLDQAVTRLRPVLLLLDPFVRLHRIDENVSSQVVPLLAYLRDLQRRHGCAVTVVHHARKGAGRARPGQALRGSSEFHSWGGSNLYVRKVSDDEVMLDIEQRAAASQQGILLRLAPRNGGLALEWVEDVRTMELLSPSRNHGDPRTRILDTLAAERRPLLFAALRTAVGMRTKTFGEVLAGLAADGLVVKLADGYALP